MKMRMEMIMKLSLIELNSLLMLVNVV